MYQTSEKFKNAVYGDSRTFLAKVSDGTHSASEEILSLKQTSRSVADDCISVGGAVSSYVEIKMWDPGFTLDGTELEISIGMTIGSEPEWVPLGLFTAQKPKSDSGVVTFTAYDRIQTRMSGAFVSELTYPCDGKAVLAEMAKKTGVPIITTNLPDGVMIPKRAVSTDSVVDESGNPVTDTKYVTPFDGYTYREALSYIAQFYGMFATMDRTGNVVFRWYATADCSISADRYYDDLTLGESVFTVEKIVCQAGNDTLSAGEGTVCMQLENPVMTQERLTVVYQQIKGLEFLPASVSFLGDPRIDVGDIITITDKSGNVVKIPLMSLVQDYDGGLLSETQSFGKSESVTGQSKGPTAQKLDRAYTDLFLVKEMVGEKANFDYVYGLEGKFKKLFGDYLSFKSGEFEDLKAKQADFETSTAKNFSAQTAQIKKLSGDFASFKTGEFEDLKSKQADFETATAKNFTATSARIDTVTGDLASYKNVVAENFSAANGKIENLETTTLKAADAKLTYATIESLNALKGDITDLNVGSLTARVATIEAAYISKTETKQLLAGYADIKLANVAAGTIGSALIGDGAITDAKIASVSANKLTAGTIDASKINVTNINADNLTVGTINGQRIGDKSIDLAKLSKEVPTKEYLDSVQNGLQNQIDNAIQTYTTDTIPTLKNVPASSWADNSTRAKHVGDICYVTNAGGNADGYCYRFTNTGTAAAPVYEWVLIKDSDVNKALQELVTVNGDISGLKSFQSETSSWRTSTDSELSSVKTRTTTIETTYSTKEETKSAADSAKSSAIESAKGYTDSAKTSVIESAKGYTDTAKTAAIASSKSYTDTATKDMATSTAVANAKKEAISEAAKDASSKASAAQSTAISAAAKDATSKADAAKSSAISTAASDATKKADAAKRSAISAAATDATTKANSAKSEAISTAASDATKKANDAKSAAISAASSDATSKANTAKSEAISAAASDATTKANAALNSAKGYADDAVDNIKVGGRNLFRNTGVEYSNNDYLIAQYPYASEPLVAGETYTVTICVTPAEKVKHFDFYLSAGYSQLAVLFVTGTKKQIISRTFTAKYYPGKDPSVNTNNGSADFYRAPNDGTVTGNSTIHWVKIEKGNKPTDWTPAPEDIDAAINTKVSTTVFNEVKQTVDANSATITKLSETVSKKADGSSVTTLSNTVNNIKQTADSNTAAISGLQTTVNKKADGSTVDTISKTLNTVKQTADSNSANISELSKTVSTKADGSTVTALTTRMSNAEQNLDGFKTTVSKTYVTSQTYNEKVGSLESGISAAQGTANTAKSTADAATKTANTAKNTADAATTTANTAKSTADTASKTASAAKTTAEGAVSTANTAKSTADSASKTASSAKSTADSAVNTANSAKSTADGAVSTANSAKSTADAAKSSVDGIEIGGRNLLKQSGHWTEKPTWWNSNGGGLDLDTSVKYLGYNTIKTTVGNGIVGNNFRYFELDTNKVYTYSAMIKVTGDAYAGNYHAPLHYHCSTDVSNINSGVTAHKYDQALPSGEWKLVYLTFTPNGKYFRPFVYIGSGNRVFNIAYLKLEEGNKPTDWTPAPEDAIDHQYTQYYRSTSTTTPTGGTWQDTVPDLLENTCIWTRQAIVHVGGDIEYSNPVLDSVTKKVVSMSAEVTKTAEGLTSTVNKVTTLTNDLAGVSTRLGTAESKISQNAESISAKVSTTEFNKFKTNNTTAINDAKSSAISAAASDATKKANDAKSSAISTAASDATKKANDAKSSAISTAASDATTKANNAKSAAISTAASDATTKANNALSSAKTYSDGQIKTVNAAITQTNSEISAMKGQIALKVEQTDINNAIDGVVVGGRNLARNTSISKTWKSTSYNCSDTWIGSDGGSGWLPRILIEKGTNYIISFDYVLENAPDDIGVGIGFGTGGSYDNDAWDIQAPYSLYGGSITSGHFVYHLSPFGREGKYFAFRPLRSSKAAGTVKITISHFKLEKGNKATDWTPAPEDDEERLSSLESWKSEASLKITKDGIIATVGSYYATGADVTALTGRVTQAESTIKQQSDSIVLTVKKDGVISAINQTSESVKISANKISLTAAGLVEIINSGDTKIKAANLNLTASDVVNIINKGTTTIKASKLDLSASDVVNIINKGTTKIEASKLDLSGYVTVSDLSGSGTTTIDGSNIKTGKISTDRLDVNGIFAKNVTATGTITGATLTGAAVSCSGSAGVMELRKGGLNGFYVTEKDNYRYTYGCAYTSTSLSLDYTKESLKSVDVQKVYVLYADSSGVNIGNLAKFSLDKKNVTFSCPTTFNDTLIAKGLSVGDIYATSISVQNSGVELYGSTPFIDFHFNKSNTDYTSRIIELESGKLNVNGAVFTNGGTIWGTGLTIAGTGTFNDDLSATRGLKLNHGGTSLYLYNESGTFCIMHTGTNGTSTWPIVWDFKNDNLAIANSINCGAYGTFGKGIISKSESVFHTGSYTDPYPGKSCTIKSWGTVASLRFAAKGVGNTWLGAAKPDGSAYDTICTDANALVPGWRVRTADGAWVGASYAQDPGFRIYYCNASRLGGNTNGTDAIYTFGASGTFHAKSVSQTSDEREKNIISGITEKYESLFMRLRPVLFNWKTGTDGIHMGFGAQTTLDLAEKCGIRENELAAVHKSKTEEPWSMSYTEIVPLAVQMVQKAITSIDSTRKEVSTLGQNMTARMESLQYQLAQAFDRIAVLEKENKSLRQALS